MDSLGHHTLRSYDKQLQHLLSLILEMGKEVKSQVLAAKNSFRAREESRVADAKTADKHINELDRQIEEKRRWCWLCKTRWRWTYVLLLPL